MSFNLKLATSIFALSSAVGLANGQETQPTEPEEVLTQDVVVVEGFRGSLIDALDQKRNASEIIEALSAEDIGQLPDTSVAESLARLPGVTSTREVAGAGALSIRGLGSVLSNGTFNGRDLASPTGDRSVPFSLFPAELISGAGVYKAPAASRVEGGVAGTVDLRTIRPLAHGEKSVVVNGRVRYNDLGGDLPTGEDTGFRGSITYIDQFADDRLGIALGYAGQDSPFASVQSSVFNYRTVGFGGFINGLPDVTSPDNPDSDLNIPFGADQDVTSGDSQRHSFIGTLQFEANENFELNADAFYTTFEQNNVSVGLFMEGIGSFGNEFSDFTLDGLNVTDATVTCFLPWVGPVNNCRSRGFGQDLFAQSALDTEESTLESYGLEGVWNDGPLTLTGDIAYSRAEQMLNFTRVEYRPYTGAAGAREIQLPVSSYGENSNSAAFLTSPLNFADASTNRIDNARVINDDTLEDEILTLKFDAEYDLEGSFISGVRAGFRSVNRENTLDAAGGRSGILLDPNDSVAISPDLILGTFNHSNANSDFDGNTVFVLDTQRVLDTVFPTLTAPDDPIGSHVIEEDVLSYYVQADLDTQLFGVPVDGNFGVRVVETSVDTQGTIGDEDTTTFVITFRPTSTSDEYTEVLPSLNLNFYPQEDLIVRFAASRAMSRPALNFLSPGVSTFGTSAFGGSGGGGNPFLRPFVADQVDLSFEKYFSDDTALTLALYYKDVDTFITQARTESGPPQNTVSFTPANGQGGTIQGLEVLYQQTFPDLLPDGAGVFGIYANYSYNDSDIELTETFDSGTYGLDGLSEHVGNITLHYDNGPLGARVSYRYRSDFTRPQRPARAFITNDSEGDLSFQVSYDATEKLRLTLQGWNLTDEARDGYYGLESLQGQYRTFGRNFELGATYRF